MDPYFIVPDKCKCVDFQMFKLQESPDAVPNGELPRHIQLYCDRYLTDKVVPGNRVTVVGVYAIKKLFGKKGKVCACVHVSVSVSVCACASVRQCVCVCMCVPACVHVSACLSVSLCLCVCVCLYV